MLLHRHQIGQWQQLVSQIHLSRCPKSEVESLVFFISQWYDLSCYSELPHTTYFYRLLLELSESERIKDSIPSVHLFMEYLL